MKIIKRIIQVIIMSLVIAFIASILCLAVELLKIFFPTIYIIFSIVIILFAGFLFSWMIWWQ